MKILKLFTMVLALPFLSIGVFIGFVKFGINSGIELFDSIFDV